MSHFSDSPFLHKTSTPFNLAQNGSICSMDLCSESADRTFLHTQIYKLLLMSMGKEPMLKFICRWFFIKNLFWPKVKTGPFCTNKEGGGEANCQFKDGSFPSQTNPLIYSVQFFGYLSRILSRLMTKPTKWHVRPAKTQSSLDIRPVWSESSLSVWRKLGSLATYWAHNEDSDQTGRKPRLIWVFAGRTVIVLGLSWGLSLVTMGLVSQ